MQRLCRWLQFIDLHQLAAQRFTDTHKRCGRDGLILAERAHSRRDLYRLFAFEGVGVLGGVRRVVVV